VASSKIEQIDAPFDDYARALHGNRSNPSAISMVASTRALADLIGSVDGGRPVTLDKVLSAHRILMADDPSERSYAGQVRDMQNWIGGSDHSPRGTLYVPPPPDTVTGYLEDLVRFANRSDLNVLAQAVISHAQFESIHPFTDGNGRIGRALINTVLRRRGTTSRVVERLLDDPVFSAEDAENLVGGGTSSIYRGIERLHETGVIRPLTSRTRNRVWVAGSLADELDDLGVRIAARALTG
jgi:Fic family protein